MEFYVDTCFDTLKAKYEDYFWHLSFDAKYIIFDQKWESTALGFSGTMGGATITKAPTFVVYGNKIKGESEVADVFFGSTYAYSCKLENPNFQEDLAKHRLESTREAKERYDSYEDDDIKLMEMIYFEEKKKNKE